MGLGLELVGMFVGGFERGGGSLAIDPEALNFGLGLGWRPDGNIALGEAEVEDLVSFDFGVGLTAFGGSEEGIPAALEVGADGGGIAGEELFLGIVVPPAEDEAFDEEATGGSWELLVPDAERILSEVFKIAFEDWFGETEVEVVVDPVVHTDAADVVVVVTEVEGGEEGDAIGGLVESVEFLEFGEAIAWHGFGPIVGRGHGEGFGGEEGGDFNVTGIDAKTAGVFAGAATLHTGADHDGGEGELNTGIDGGSDKGLGTAAACAGDTDPVGVDFGEG